MSRKSLVLPIIVVAVIFAAVRISGMRRSSLRDKEPVVSEKDVPASKPKADASIAQPSKPVSTDKTVLPQIKLPSNSFQMPESLAVVLGNGNEPYLLRIKAVHALSKNLSDSEILCLYLFLNRKQGQDNLPLEEVNAIKNDVVSVLKVQETKPACLANNLMAMYYDREHDNVWRDYCIQHLGNFYSKIGDPAEQKLARETFWKAAEEMQISIAGTALIALSNNTGSPGFDKAAIGNKALALVLDPKCGELAEITALQICANLGEKGVLPPARKISDSSASVPLRMSAIAAIGTIGEESDRLLLEKYSASSDTRLRTAALSALKRLAGSRQ